ncbi:hypothetical protein EYF80_019661 [Liparis tanakae]|uniref:Uncharacterized protein n=1 Tax=Liparis tanakae TaxID=230148 RepID=A0A4Z2HX96_9TELE|nr:hypothetical protein EYF80_019661 [Liparis tanakae]
MRSCSLPCCPSPSCSTVSDTREPPSTLSCRGILDGSWIRGPWAAGPLSSSWAPLSPSRL